MKVVRLSVLVIFVASAAIAQLTPGAVVQTGEPFPIVTDFNGDGLDDLVQDRNVLLSHAGSFTESRDLGLPDGETVYAVLDVNGDHIPDLITVNRVLMVPPEIDPNARPGAPTYRLYIGSAARTYANPITLAAGNGLPPYVADVDGDGKDDLILLKDLQPDGNRPWPAT